MKYYCYSCQQQNQLLIDEQCINCGSAALQYVTEGSNPLQFQPPTQTQKMEEETKPQEAMIVQQQAPQSSPQQQQRQQRPQQSSTTSTENSSNPSHPSQNEPIVLIPVMMPPFLINGALVPPQPVVYRFTFYTLDPQDIKTPISKQRFQTLEKVASLDDECVICQEKERAGLRLPCKHQFHTECIEPWFKETNTCPCCRAVITD